MKKLILLLLSGTLLIGSESSAQQAAPRKEMTKEQRAENGSLRMKSQLTLSDEQTKRVFEVLLRMDEEVGNDQDAMRRRQEATDKLLSQILTPEQFNKYQHNQIERRETTEDQRRGKHAPPSEKMQEQAPVKQ